MKRYLLAFTGLVWAFYASAETWEWVDGQGIVSFTDDLQNIPRPYRKVARKIDGGNPPAPQVPVSVGGEIPGDNSPHRYGDRTAPQWREAFTTQNGEIRRVDGELKEKHRLLQGSGTISRSDYLKLEDEIRQLNSRLNVLLARWEQLNKEATVASVPGELRQ